MNLVLKKYRDFLLRMIYFRCSHAFADLNTFDSDFDFDPAILKKRIRKWKIKRLGGRKRSSNTRKVTCLVINFLTEHWLHRLTLISADLYQLQVLVNKVNQVWCLVQYSDYTCKLFLVVPSYRNESAVQVTLNYKLEIACCDDFSV